MSKARQTRSERGASAVEYALLIAGIAGLLVLVVFALGGQTAPNFEDTCNDIAAEMASPSC